MPTWHDYHEAKRIEAILFIDCWHVRMWHVRTMQHISIYTILKTTISSLIFLISNLVTRYISKIRIIGLRLVILFHKRLMLKSFPYPGVIIPAYRGYETLCNQPGAGARRTKGQISWGLLVGDTNNSLAFYFHSSYLDLPFEMVGVCVLIESSLVQALSISLKSTGDSALGAFWDLNCRSCIYMYTRLDFDHHCVCRYPGI